MSCACSELDKTSVKFIKDPGLSVGVKFTRHQVSICFMLKNHKV